MLMFRIETSLLEQWCDNRRLAAMLLKRSIANGSDDKSEDYRGARHA